jgi:hypothetical protein
LGKAQTSNRSCGCPAARARYLNWKYVQRSANEPWVRTEHPVRPRSLFSSERPPMNRQYVGGDR